MPSQDWQYTSHIENIIRSKFFVLSKRTERFLHDFGDLPRLRTISPQDLGDLPGLRTISPRDFGVFRKIDLLMFWGNLFLSQAMDHGPWGIVILMLE